MSTLDVPNAHLYYESRGNGPGMLLIPGAPGDARVFSPLADRLAERYTVITYDRRGFSRSWLDGPQDYAHRLRTDADDARRLIHHLSDEPITIFGSSSGAVVALQLLTDHPHAVKTIIPYEPAVLRVLPDGQHWVDFCHELYALYRQCGPAPALTKFRQRAFPESDQVVMNRAADPDNAPQLIANATYWFERELREYTNTQLDQDTLIEHAERILPAIGRTSRGYPAYAAGIELAKMINRSVLELPGGHTGYLTDPTNFAAELRAALN